MQFSRNCNIVRPPSFENQKSWTKHNIVRFFAFLDSFDTLERRHEHPQCDVGANKSNHAKGVDAHAVKQICPVRHFVTAKDMKFAKIHAMRGPDPMVMVINLLVY